MDIQRCFEILELDPDVGANEAKQAYKDLVNIWHPDRFAGNPRLQKKSEDKLKDINIAYETIRPVLLSQKVGGATATQQSNLQKKAETGTRSGPVSETNNFDSEGKTGTSGKTEAFVEAGTSLILNVFSSLYSAVRSIVKDATAEMDLKNSDQQQNDVTGNKLRQKGRGRGRGKGRGKRGGGRGCGRR